MRLERTSRFLVLATVAVAITIVLPAIPVHAECCDFCKDNQSFCLDAAQAERVRCNQEVDDLARDPDSELTPAQIEAMYQACTDAYSDALDSCDYDYRVCCDWYGSVGPDDPTDPVGGGGACCYQDGWCPPECGSCDACNDEQ